MSVTQKQEQNLEIHKTYHQIVVTDKGIGFAPDSDEKIFIYYFSASARAK